LLIRAEKITKSFGSLQVLKGIDLNVEKGKIHSVVGASGAGKTTLLQILGTLSRPDSGNLYFEGRNIAQFTEKEIAAFRNRQIGFVFQFHHLLPEFNALENTMMPGLISGMQREEASDRAGTLLEEVGLGHRTKHKPGELSGGEQQRVAVARALMMEPEIILADEPTGNLDSETGRKVYETMLGLNQSRNITLIVVTHNRTLAKHMSRRIELEDGKITHSE